MTEIFKDARKREYLNAEGADKPLKSPIPPATLKKARGCRKQRLVEKLQEHDCAAILLYDPCNIRYALDVSNMQVWMTAQCRRTTRWWARTATPSTSNTAARSIWRTASRPSMKCARPRPGSISPPATVWRSGSMPGPTRSTTIVRERGGGNRRLAVDKLEPQGVDALRRRGITIVEGQELTEHARAIKSPEELELMQWTIRVCEAGMARMYEHSLPGKTENEIWAELHYENIRSGGEWIETRLLAIGERTNPWFQECSDHVGKQGDILAFDTDMIGPYGYCADLSRSWTIGHTRMSNTQRELYAAALEQIHHNVGLLKPGLSFREFNEKSWRIPEKYQARRYRVALHGVGMADEYPVVPLHPDFARAYGGAFEENMTVCVESLIGEEGGRECVKLETQVLITAAGAERLDSFPWEEV